MSNEFIWGLFFGSAIASAFIICMAIRQLLRERREKASLKAIARLRSSLEPDLAELERQNARMRAIRGDNRNPVGMAPRWGFDKDGYCVGCGAEYDPKHAHGCPEAL